MAERALRPAECRGSLLIITLWLVVTLSVLAVAVGRYLSLEVRLLAYRAARERAKVLARSGVDLAIQRLVQDGSEDSVDWPGDNWSFSAAAPWVVPVDETDQANPPAGDYLAIAVVDEESKLDLNSETTAPIGVLTRLVGEPAVAAAIVDYRDPPDPEVEDQPALPYFAKNGPMRVLEELLDIPAVVEQPATIPILMRYGTLHTAGRLNANTASAQVLQAVKSSAQPAVPDEVIQAFVDRRGVGADQSLGTSDDCLMTSQPSSLQAIANCLATSIETVQNLVVGLGHDSSTFHVTATGTVQQPPVAYRVEAIVKRSTDGTPPQIIAWKEG